MMKKCNVCNLTESKYRCPKCRILYCSVTCYKTHKDNSCEEFKQPEETILRNTTINGSSLITKEVEPGELTDEELDVEDKVSQEKLSLLENSQKIKDMLLNKHLQRVLKTIDEKDSEQELEAAMKLPLFVEFANECLKLVDD
ncbi:zinc finger HIT domain-containing protein 3-like [Dendronephthya gigantea]|uniref:zinc finger HIT domain-containing protein 3-like n=1 Tax=Dendronephthya gigantea TaxID=151771 RepID=UPI00106A7DB9|nr:zinc finger HIT domain-containing protein 3-like [Dendronephthya gigantea]